MGGLFSSQPEPPRRTSYNRPQFEYESYRIANPPPRPSYSYQPTPIRTTSGGTPAARVNEMTRTLNSLYISPQQVRPLRQVQGPTKSLQNLDMFNLIDSLDYSWQVVRYIPLDQYDHEYSLIKNKITNKRNFRVDSIEKIENPFLETAYELKKAQKQKEFSCIQELLLFHGTKRVYIDEICKKNFDWRCCKAHKYGKGVSFSPNSTYASVYSDDGTHNKVMLVAKVMVGRSCIGNKTMTLPPDGCDTSQKGAEGIVIVKFEDNDFYPVYKINYHVMDAMVGKRQRNRNNRGGNSGRGAQNAFLYDDSFYDDFDYSF